MSLEGARGSTIPTGLDVEKFRGLRTTFENCCRGQYRPSSALPRGNGRTTYTLLAPLRSPTALIVCRICAGKSNDVELQAGLGQPKALWEAKKMD